MKIVDAYCAGARDITVVGRYGARDKGRIGKGNRKRMPHTKRRKCARGPGGGGGNTRHSCARGERLFDFNSGSAEKRGLSEEIFSTVAFPAAVVVPLFPHFLPSSSLPRPRQHLPRGCARGNRSVEQGSPPALDFIPLVPSLSFSSHILPYRPFISVGSYMPRNIYRFPIIRAEALLPPPRRGPPRGARGS